MKLREIRRPHEPKPFGAATNHLHLLRGHAGDGPTAYVPGRLLKPQATEKAQNGSNQRLATLDFFIGTDFIASPLHCLVSPFVAAAGHTLRGYQSKSKRSLHSARLPTHDDAGLRELTRASQSACNARMDDADPGVAFGSRDRQAAESHPAKPGNDSRNAGLRDASSIGAAASVQVIEGFTNQPVEPPRGLIFGDLSIPSSGVKLGVPSAKRRHLTGRQLLDRRFDFLDGAHGRQYTLRGHCRQRPVSGLTAALTGPPPSNIDLRNDAIGGSASNALLSDGW